MFNIDNSAKSSTISAWQKKQTLNASNVDFDKKSLTAFKDSKLN
jgi:hypothetical protein